MEAITINNGTLTVHEVGFSIGVSLTNGEVRNWEDNFSGNNCYRVTVNGNVVSLVHARGKSIGIGVKIANFPTVTAVIRDGATADRLHDEFVAALLQ